MPSAALSGVPLGVVVLSSAFPLELWQYLTICSILGGVVGLFLTSPQVGKYWAGIYTFVATCLMAWLAAVLAHTSMAITPIGAAPFAHQITVASTFQMWPLSVGPLVIAFWAIAGIYITWSRYLRSPRKKIGCYYAPK